MNACRRLCRWITCVHSNSNHPVADWGSFWHIEHKLLTPVQLGSSSLSYISQAARQPISHLSWEVLVSDKVLGPGPLIGGEVFRWAPIQGLQIQVEIFIPSDVLQVQDVLTVLRPAELPAGHCQLFSSLLSESLLAVGSPAV